MGESVPYPTVRDGRDLRKNRNALLKKCRESRIASFTQHQAAKQIDAAVSRIGAPHHTVPVSA